MGPAFHGFPGKIKNGRGGWTWYTGSAGWLYRAAVEGILGIERHGKRIEINPRLPTDWDGYSARLNMAGAECSVRVMRAANVKAISLEVNGTKVKGSSFEFKSGAKLEVTVRIPTAGRGR